MICSPAQANRLLCPFQRGTDGKVLACRSQNCMAWRFADQTSAFGFCGLAGTPEVYRLQSGELPPVRHGRTVLTRTERTVDQGKSIEAQSPEAEF